MLSFIFEKLFDILLWRRLTVGSEVWDAKVYEGFNKTIEKNNTNKNEKYEKNISENYKNLGSKNLADFFNGEIIDFNE